MEDKTVVICAEVGSSKFTDNIDGECHECGAPIAWRPHVPEPSIKLCIPCGFASMNEAEAAGEEIEMATNPEQVAEIEAIFGPGALGVGHAMLEALRKWGGK